MIKINNSDISDIKIAGQSVSKVMTGTNQVWPIGQYKMMDILYSDIDGKLSVSSDVLPVSEGKIPIGLCIAPTGFFGENEPARFMSLKYMNYTTPEVGSATYQKMFFGSHGTDIDTITNIGYIDKSGLEIGYLTTDWGQQVDNKIPSVFNENNEYNIYELGTINQYAATDIDGKIKTSKILETATAQPTWKTDQSIINSSDHGYATCACCCARYHTLGTKAGDWYLCSSGELAVLITLKDKINSKLRQINILYPNDSIDNIADQSFWTSTEKTGNYMYYISAQTCRFSYAGKASPDYASFAMIRY